ncbi:mersacidin/lichenicidin family type 2 lantibiotic [Streptosporangium roseum]|uniref:mersacidin/lichenicidin family type 2 lantibiotic n=1 Tax=Streptosporangium roseum TaxID=2001 RepID=UPI0033251C75
MDLVRAWKDPEYRSTLSHTPAHPSGGHELARLDTSDLVAAAGGKTAPVGSLGCFCSPKTFTMTSPILCSITLSVCP